VIISILWEDQRGVQVKGFGPHDLLLKCLEDDGVGERAKLDHLVRGLPKKGNGNVVKQLSLLAPRDGTGPHDGPVLGVLDWDEAPRLGGLPSSVCFAHARFHLGRQLHDARSIVFLDRNVETLVSEARALVGEPSFGRKPTAQERDHSLHKLVWSPEKDKREALRRGVPTFGYLVQRVAEHIARAR